MRSVSLLRKWPFLAAGLASGLTLELVSSAAEAACDPTNIAQGKTATASSTENASFRASNAVDGDANTRWSSQFADPQWLQIDLGSSQQLCEVDLDWETAFASAFQIQISPDGNSWSNAFSTTNGTGGTQSIPISGSGRFVRVNGTQRATQWGYSLFEVAVHAQGSGTGVPPTDPKNPNFGPNVFVYGPGSSQTDMQNQLTNIFNQQHTNQFGSQRYAFLFKPGTYTADVNLGFYTTVAGLGLSPDDVNLNGHVRVEADWLQQGSDPNNKGNATQNFWRGSENLSVTLPSGQIERWAVSQAVPYRRMHLRGQIQLWNGGDGWSSGGLIADTKIDGLVESGSQQQFLTRNSELGSWSGGNWNMVFVGSTGTPAQSFPNPPETVVAQAPVVREKPFLYIDGTGSYNVFVPALRQNVQGSSWAHGSPAGSSISLSQFYVASPSSGAATINAALAQGLHVLFTPGIYHLNQALHVTQANTILLGLGLATLIPDGGVSAITVDDVDGVKVGGLLIDAGTTNSPVLVQFGPSGSSASHAGNPSSFHDLFFRVGGAGAGKATQSLVINSSDVIGDHTWIWRADHGAGVGWTTNTANNGLVVNGANVTIYGLFVEHYQQYNVLWNGNGGRTYFFQNELPYDVPDQGSWTSGGGNQGWAAYKVGDSVTSHEAWGVGSYCFFNVNNSIVASHAFEVPNASGVRFHDLVTVSLGGVGTINHVINNSGDIANSGHQVSDLNSFP